MLNHIIGFSIRNKLIIGLFTLGLIAYGIYQTTLLPIDAVPDITNNQVQVITTAPSLGASDIERLVTFPIEQANANIGGIHEIRSFSRFGLSLVTIVFEDDVDIFWARQQVSERLQKIQSQIPTSIGSPELGPITTGLGEVYQYVVRPKKGYENKYKETDLRTIQDWIIRRQLIGIKGVAEVSSFGGKLKQYEIAVHPNKLQSYNLSIEDIFQALQRNNENTGGAYIEKGPVALFIRTEGLVKTIDEIGNICIRTTENGMPIFIRDVAEVGVGFSTRYGAMCYNDEGEVTGAIVMMQKGANSNQVIQRIKKRIDQIQKNLPEGVVIEPFLDRSKMVKNAIHTVETNLLEGALIVVFILVLFLGNLRAGLIVASVIPLSMLFAIILMNAFGVSGNLMSLGALDFGLIVDGAVIIVEAVMHRFMLRQFPSGITKLSQTEMDQEVGTAAGKMMNSAVFGQFIILIVYLPIFALSGIEGKMFKPMAQTVAFALLGSFLLSLTYIPMMSALFLSKKVQNQNLSDRILRKVESIFQRLLLKSMRFAKVILVLILVLFAGSIFLLLQMGGEFIPALEEGDFAVEARVLTGSNLNTTIDYTKKASRILLNGFPEVEKVVTKIGSGEVPTDPMPIEASDMMVILKEKSQWTSAKTYPDLAAKMSEALAVLPGLSTGFQFPVQMRFNELMTGSKQDVACKIFGENLDSLAKYAAKLETVIQKVEGVHDIYVEPITGMPQIVIKYDRDKIAQYNLNIEAINKAVNTAFAGQVTGSVYEEEKRFDLVVRLHQDKRQDLENVAELLIQSPLGMQIPLHQIASVAIENSPNQIQREDAKRRIIVGFNVRNRDVQSIVEEVETKIQKQIRFPAGYYVSYGGAFENLRQAKERLSIAVPVSLLLILLLLYFAFGSIKQGLLIYTAIPLSAMGGIFFLSLREMPFSISAGIGFIALFGVAVLNGIVLIAEFNHLRKLGQTNLVKVVIEGTKTRLRPVLMTAFVASLGFLPMALSTGAGAEVQRPLATVVIGGLFSATLLTLFVLPVLYPFFEKRSALKISSRPTAILILCTILGFGKLQAQNNKNISLKAAIDSAFKNNLQIKQKNLVAQYQEKLKSASFTIPKSNLNSEVGQFNSVYLDSKIGISQNFNLPSVYAIQKQLLTNEWETAVLSISLSRAEIRKMVSSIFYGLLVLNEKEKLLVKEDSLFSEFLAQANLRLEKGESNVLEKNAADMQAGNIQNQLRLLRSEKEILQLQLQLMLNSKTAFSPAETTLIQSLDSDLQTGQNSLFISFFGLQLLQAKNHLKLEKAQLLPDILLGYSNTSIRGIGADERFYKGINRFHMMQFGLGIPLFMKANKARIQASQTKIAIAENELQWQKSQLETEKKALFTQYTSQLETVRFFQNIQNANANSIQKIARSQLNAGAINYLDWAYLNQQAFQIKTSYLDAIQRLNEIIIQLNYLNSNTSNDK